MGILRLHEEYSHEGIGQNKGLYIGGSRLAPPLSIAPEPVRLVPAMWAEDGPEPIPSVWMEDEPIPAVSMASVWVQDAPIPAASMSAMWPENAPEIAVPMDERQGPAVWPAMPKPAAIPSVWPVVSIPTVPKPAEPIPSVWIEDEPAPAEPVPVTLTPAAPVLVKPEQRLIQKMKWRRRRRFLW